MSVNTFDTYSPSPQKPKALIEYWDKNLSYPLQLICPKPATLQELCLVHDPVYVANILSLKEDNGFHNRLSEVAKTLPYTSGSLLSAARHVLREGGVACSPTSGFHHAHYKSARAFCNFNGLMVTAFALKNEGLVKRVGILDCDYHYADGTMDIMSQLQIDWIQHYCKGIGYQTLNPEEFLSSLPQLIENLADYDILLYQAGADAHIDDPLGGFLTTEQMIKRDYIVFSEVKRWNIPLVWNLAGGYQVEVDSSGMTDMHKILVLHTNTMKQCIKVYAKD